jgi:hypothetical protein
MTTTTNTVIADSHSLTTQPPEELQSQSPLLIHRGVLTNIYRINSRLALKITTTTTTSGAENSSEQTTFDIFEKQVPCPHIIQSFYRLSGPGGPTTTGIGVGVTFLEYLPGGSLAERLRGRQVFGFSHGQEQGDGNGNEDVPQKKEEYHGQGQQLGSGGSVVARVTQTESIEQIEVWAEQLCRGAEWMESIGFAHCDIRPANLLLDGQLNLKLADFERTRRIGEFLDGGTPPFVRLVGEDHDRAGEDEKKYRGTYGLAGSRSEQFAIGSVLYCVTRGHEPFEDVDLGLHPGVEIMNRLKRMEFPKLRFGDENYRLDDIIRRCWNGEYLSVKELADEVTSTGETRSYEVDLLTRKDRREECRQLVEEGILERLEDADI